MLPLTSGCTLAESASGACAPLCVSLRYEKSPRKGHGVVALGHHRATAVQFWEGKLKNVLSSYVSKHLTFVPGPSS